MERDGARLRKRVQREVSSDRTSAQDWKSGRGKCVQGRLIVRPELLLAHEETEDGDAVCVRVRASRVRVYVRVRVNCVNLRMRGGAAAALAVTLKIIPQDRGDGRPT